MAAPKLMSYNQLDFQSKAKAMIKQSSSKAQAKLKQSQSKAKAKR